MAVLNVTRQMQKLLPASEKLCVMVTHLLVKCVQVRFIASHTLGILYESAAGL